MIRRLTSPIASVEELDLEAAVSPESGTVSVDSHSSVSDRTPCVGVEQSRIGREPGPDALAGFSGDKSVVVETGR